MTARLVETEITTAAALRRRALSLERTASVQDFNGMARAAGSSRAVARRLRGMAALVEVGPFASEYVGPRVLAEMVAADVAEALAPRRSLQSAVTRRGR